MHDIEDYRPIIRRIARSTCYSSAAIDFNDLCQVGEIAAFRAVKLYNPTCGAGMKSFVVCSIRREIYNEAARFLGVFTVDRRVTTLAAKVNRMVTQGLSDEDIALKLNKDVGQVRDLRIAYNKRSSVCVDHHEPLDDNDFTEEQMRELLLNIINSPEEYIILLDRVLGHASAKDIADTLQISQSRLYILEKRLKERIRRAIV